MTEPIPSESDDANERPPMSRRAMLWMLIQHYLEIFRYFLQTLAPFAILLGLTGPIGRGPAAVAATGAVLLATFFPPPAYGHSLTAIGPKGKALLAVMSGAMFVLFQALVWGLASVVLAQHLGVVRPWLSVPFLAGFGAYPFVIVLCDLPVCRYFDGPPGGWKVMLEGLNPEDSADSESSREK